MALNQAIAQSDALVGLNSIICLLQQSVVQSNFMLKVAAEPLIEKLEGLRDRHLQHLDELADAVLALGGLPAKAEHRGSFLAESLGDVHVAERLLLPYCKQEQEIIDRCSEQLYFSLGNESLTAVLQRIRRDTRDQLLLLFNSRQQ